MRFGKSKLSPSYARKPNFKSHESTESCFQFNCINCNAPIEVEYHLLINRGLGWAEEIGEHFACQAKEFYRIGLVGKSQDGGWPSMVKVPCDKCKTLYLVYAGVNEVRNSVYYVTLQGITEICEEDKYL
jgi:hypothetical protein